MALESCLNQLNRVFILARISQWKLLDNSGKQKKKAQTYLVSRQRVVQLDNTTNERSDFTLFGKIEVSLVSLLVVTVLITRVV